MIILLTQTKTILYVFIKTLWTNRSSFLLPLSFLLSTETLASFEYIQQCLKFDWDIRLLLTKRSSVSMELTRMVRPRLTADGLVTQQHVFVLFKPQETPLGNLF